MADNVTITSGANSTPPANTVIATDDVGGAHYQVVKIALGLDSAVDTHLDSGQQLSAASVPVVIASDQSVISIDDNSGSLTVDGTVTAQPLSAILEGGLTELVGINEQVDQNEYSASVGVALGGTYSGEILSFALYATEDGTGAVQDSDGWLLVLDADPATTAGDTALTAAEWVTVLGRARVTPADWITDANGGVAYIYDTPIPFHALATLYFVWLHKDATSLNDGAGDDEQLEFNFWYRRES